MEGYPVYSACGPAALRWGKVQKKALASRQEICTWDSVMEAELPFFSSGTPCRLYIIIITRVYFGCSCEFNAESRG